MSHHIRVRHDTDRASLTQHMAKVLREYGRFTVSASDGEAGRNMQWAIASLDGYFEGYAVAHSRINHVPGSKGDEISIIETQVWLEKEEGKKRDADSRKA